MSVQPRRVQISSLGDSVRELIREVHESEDEFVLMDGERELASVRRLKNIAPPVNDMSDDLTREQKVWAEIVAIRGELTKAWNSPLSGAEAIEA